jgi:hypothetical protein
LILNAVGPQRGEAAVGRCKEVPHGCGHAKSFKGIRRESEDRQLASIRSVRSIHQLYRCIRHYPEEFDFNIVSTGQVEFGIDGIAIIVNDGIVDDEEQLDDIIAHNPVLQIQFLFVQAKTSSFFDSGDLSKFFQAVLDFFKEKASFQQNERVLELQRIKNRLYDSAAKFVRGLPKIALYYATTGTWTDDKNLCAIRDGFLAQLSALHMFAATSFHPLDATKVQKLYFQTKNAFRVSISFGQNLSLPEIPNVRESYIGLLPISEYLKMITDDDGNVRRRLFFDNIRDFQGDTPVNKSSQKYLKFQHQPMCVN